MTFVRLTPLAETDLQRRADYLESQRRGYARRFLTAFDQTSRRITKSPQSIARYDVEHPSLSEMRVIPVDGFSNLLILFRIVDATVEILRIVHGAQDIGRMTDEILPE